MGRPAALPRGEVFGLPDLSAQAATVQSDAEALADWVAAVAYAFEKDDAGLLHLLLDHPEVAATSPGA